MGRSPCCEKVGLKKGPWTPEEDQKLLAYIEEHGHGSWRALPEKAGLQRCGKSCRLRWTNYLRPDIKRGKFSLQEEQTIIQLHALLGNRWSAIATHLPKRTDNEIKNYWNTHLKKRLTKMGIDPVTHKPMNDTLLSSDGQAKNAANLSHMAQWESARLEAEARLVRQSKLLSAGSTSSQTQNSEMASSSSQLQKPIEPMPCLDVLKVWSNGVLAKTSAVNGGSMAMGEVESPTSTLTSSVRVGEGGAAKSDNCKNMPEFKSGVYNPVTFQTFHESSSTFAATVWPPESARSSSSENGAPCPNIMEKFTDLLLSASPGEKCIGDDCLGAEDVNGGGGHYFEDNKNYWDSILNLVNSSPSDSPIF